MNKPFALSSALATGALLCAGAAQAANIEASLSFDQPTGTVQGNQPIEVWLTLTLASTSDPLVFDTNAQPFDVSGLPGPLPTQGFGFDPVTNTNITGDFVSYDGAFMNTSFGCSGTFTNVCDPAAYKFDFHLDDSDPLRPSINFRSTFSLLPGESFRFLFGTFTPVGTAAAPGGYTFYSAFVSVDVTGVDDQGRGLTASIADIAKTCPEGEPGCAQPFTRTVVTAVPEPATWGLMGLGLAGIVAFGRRRRQA